MTAVTTTTATPYNGNSSSDDAEKSRSSESFVPSASEEEAKTRFTTSVAAGVDFLMCRGVGREQASRELLNIVANGCSPDEEEIFKVMETCGLSFDDATKVITVAAAFKAAANTGGATSKTEAIDQLTSRLNFSRLAIKNEVRSSSLSSSSSTSSLPSSPNKQSVHNISRKDSAGATSPTAFTKRNNKLRAKGDKVGRPIQKGKKRALPRAEDSNNNSSADIEVKEKMLQVKLKDGKRAKSPESKQRTKRTPVQQLEEPQATKRARGNPPDAASSCSKEVL